MARETPQFTDEPGEALAAELLRSSSVEDAATALLTSLHAAHGPTLCVVLQRDSQSIVLPPGPEPGGEARVLAENAEGRVRLQAREGALPAFSARDQHALALAARRLSELLDLRALRHAGRLQRALFAIADMAGSQRDMPSILRALHAEIGQLMYAENFYIVLYHREQDALEFLYFADTVDTQPDEPMVPMKALERGLTWYLIHDRRPLMGRTEELRRQVSGELVVRGEDSFDWLGVPMLRDGEAMGALVVQSYAPTLRYTQTERAVLAFVADHVLTALERKRGQEELERRVRERTRELQREIDERQRSEHLQAMLYRIAALSTMGIDSHEFYGLIHRAVGELLEARNFYIALLSADGRQLEFPYSVDDIDRHRPTRPLAQGLSEYVIRHGRPLLADAATVRELTAAGELAPGLAALGAPARLWLGVPLMTGGEAIGLVAVQSYRDEQVYDARDMEVLAFASHQIARTLERRRHALELEQRVAARTRELSEQIAVREQVEAQLKHQVMHDALTGLPNRLYLRDRLERALADHRRNPTRDFALLYLDVDRFKLFNDSLGHLAGDEVLREVARRLKRCIREPDVAARLSGDEFAILLEHTPIPQTACKVAQRVLAAMQPPLVLGGRELQLSASIGIAISHARHDSVDALLHDADVALYRAKDAGRQRFVLFDESLHRTAMDVLDLEHQLRAALQRQEFRCWFQPLVRLADGGIVGYEALVRWEHPSRGLLAPGAFLEVAEESGLAEALDWQLYRIALREGAPLVERGGYLALNLSPRHFQDERFVEHLLALAHEAGFDPARLRVEVTEGTLLGDPAAVAAALDRLHAAGIEAALDDFGTGYSSLSYVNRFRLRMIKIDRSFVAPLGGPQAQRSSAIISAILALAHSLGLEVIAEGVETEAQRQALLAMGCEHAQGWYFGRPQPVAAWL